MKIRQLLLLITGLITGVTSAQTDWKIKSDESYIVFIAKNLGLSVSGKITGMQVTGHYDADNVMNSKLTGTLQVSTINTGIDLRDNHLRSADYFDAKKYPTIKFQTKSITTEGSALVALGDLTIKGVTREEKIKFTVERKGNTRIFTGDITIQRRDYEVGSNSTLVMADTIRVRVFVVFESTAKDL